MHVLLEYIPLIVFLIVYKFQDIYWATGALIVASALQILFYMVSKKPIPKQTLVFFFLILCFGGLTIFLQDDAFIKWKVTIINVFFASALLIGYYGFKKIILKTFLGEAIQLPDKIWVNLTWAWAGFFTLCGILNWYIAFNFSQETWVNFKVFGLTGLTFVFAITTIVSLYKYLPEEEQTASDKTNQTEK
ncbi:putative intracellular septation protein A [Thalassotalea loyana]|uniref:Inner membrane-spanning protein YciB n=1 Tax=Thalassotalea loyana TaxID=280483 RepID=A0ABQ6HEN2_9GAMM|nr:septation protein A [Thalassotalea loyana]GLX86548.1 putative intracellular septation protein A [Thalassotalea loyana]